MQVCMHQDHHHKSCWYICIKIIIMWHAGLSKQLSLHNLVICVLVWPRQSSVQQYYSIKHSQIIRLLLSLLCNSGKPLTTFTYSHWYCVFCATVPKHQKVSDIPIVVPSVQLWQTILHFQLFPLILCLLCNLDKPSCTFIYSHWYCALYIVLLL